MSNLHENRRRDWRRKYKKIIFISDTPAYVACLDELQKQQIIDQKIYDQRLMEDTVGNLAWEGLQKNILMDGDTMIDKRTGVFYLLQYFVELSRGDVSVLHCLWDDISYAI